MDDAFSRTRLLLGSAALDRLAKARVAVFGLGGVGSFAAEALARSGIGSLVLIDGDDVALSNLNRQLVALHSTLGKPKVQVMRDRIMDINPHAKVDFHYAFYGADTAQDMLSPDLSYVVDAMDMVSAKIDLILRSQAMGLALISSMGTGNKLDPTCLRIVDIYETSLCPLARVMRRELRKRGVTELKVLYSTEEPIPRFSSEVAEAELPGARPIPGSLPTVPAAAGLIIAAQVIRALSAPHDRAHPAFNV